MTKKPIDISKISSDLSQSSAFFKKPSPLPPSYAPQQQSSAPVEMNLPQTEPLVATMQPTSQASTVTTLDFTDKEIDELKATAHVSQTYRFTDPELSELRDIVYRLNNTLTRGKVAQVDILRIALKLFVKCFTDNHEAVVSVIKKVK